MAREQQFTILQTWDGIARSDLVVAPYRVDYRLRAVTLQISLDAPFFGDPPPPMPVGSCEGLWNFEVVELFLAAADGCYCEIEVGPHGHYLVLCFDGYRVRRRRVDQLVLTTAVGDGRWSARAELALEHVPRPIVRANAFAIHGQGDDRDYLAAYPMRTGQPDFHRVERFPLLSAASEPGTDTR